jgi:hypothetical protein
MLTTMTSALRRRRPAGVHCYLAWTPATSMPSTATSAFVTPPTKAAINGVDERQVRAWDPLC